MLRIWGLKILAVASVSMATSCGSAVSHCNVNTCSHGCCDAEGVCQAAGTDAVCDLTGAACSTCSSPRHCSALDAGMCRVITTFPLDHSFSVYARSADGGLEHAVAQLLNPGSPPDNSIEVDIYWAFTGQQTGMQIPSVRNLANEPDYSTCGSCVVIRENCPDLDTCERAYFARAGTIDVDDITRGSTGEFKVRLENVQLNRWQLGGDHPIEDRRCLFLESTTFDVPHD